MRHAVLALALVVIGAARAALGFEIEEERLFPASGNGPELSILSTADTFVFAPLIEAYQARNPGVAVRYVVAGSQAVFAAINDEGARFDLVISSAMDLQMKLANDGFAAPHRAVEPVPAWARWQDRLYAFTQEPVVLLVARPALTGLPMPRSRRDLIALLRDHPERFAGRIGTYDPRLSGAGYLFATQEARQSDSYWRLAEVMGATRPRLYTNTNQMIADLQAGRLAMAYNVLGSYAEPRLAPDGPDTVIELEDYTLTLLRTAFVPQNAVRPELGHAFLTFLLSTGGRAVFRNETGLPPVDDAQLAENPHRRPIRLDPGLLVYLDAQKRRRFLEEWTAAFVQP